MSKESIHLMKCSVMGYEAVMFSEWNHMAIAQLIDSIIHKVKFYDPNAKLYWTI